MSYRKMYGYNQKKKKYKQSVDIFNK